MLSEDCLRKHSTALVEYEARADVIDLSLCHPKKEKDKRAEEVYTARHTTSSQRLTISSQMHAQRNTCCT